MILETLFSITLFISGGHLVSTNLKLHHYSDEDYKGIFYLKNNDSITKHCLKHSELEDIKKIRHQRHNNGENTSVTDYKVLDVYYEKIIINYSPTLVGFFVYR